MAAMLRDVKGGLRLLGRNPGFALVAVLTMAAGIAANTTVFAWIHTVLLNPLPGAGAPGRVMALETVAPSGEHLTTSYPDYRDIRDQNTLLDGVAVSHPRALRMGEDAYGERVWAELVSGNFFEVLRVRPALGRFFEGAERGDTQDAHPVIVISHALWTRRFEADPAAIGSTVKINRFPYTIIGVAPPGFVGSMAGLAFQVWAPATMYGRLTATGDWYLRDRKTRAFLAFARLKDGVEPGQARGELRAIGARMAEANGVTNQGISVTVLPLWEANFGAQKTLRGPLGTLMGVCALVLLIVCANVASLLLARAAAREKEFSIRVALGAARKRLLQQVLVETLVMAMGGAGLGLALAMWLRRSLAWLAPASTIPALAEPSLAFEVLGFTAALAVVVALLAGIAPALRASRADVQEALKAEGRGSTAGAPSLRLRGALVVTEVALAAITLIGAGLFLKSFSRARKIDPGFDPRNVVIAQFSLSNAAYNREQAESFCLRLRERLESAPGLNAVSYADFVPLGFDGGSWEDLTVEGYVPSPSENMKIYRNLVAPGYFNLMKIPILEGRDIAGRDDRNSERVMVVNQSFARRFLRGESPLGRKVRGWGQWFTVVGMVRDAQVHSLTESPKPFFYVPIRQIFRPEMPLTFHVRSALPPEQAIAAVRQAGRAVDPGAPLYDAMTLEQYTGAALFGQRLAATLLAVLSCIALLLAALGLYSVMAYMVVQRTHELGIRMALGASPRAILGLVMSQGMMLALGGLAAGWAGAAALGRVVAAALEGVSPADPAVYGAAGAVLMLVSVLAAWIPASRAMRVDPMISLRAQ